MEQVVCINYLAVLVAGAAYMLLGALWYSPALFGNLWTAGIGKTREQVQKDYSAWKLIFAFVGSFLAAYGIARVLVWSYLDPLWGGFAIALVGSVCFLIAPMGINELMEHRSPKLFFINAFYNLTGFIIMGLIIGLWQ